MRNLALLVRKDLRILRRSPVLLSVLLAYPVAIALLVGLVAGYASSKPRVALVDEDGLPSKVVIGGQTFDIDRTLRRASKDVTLVRLSPEDARRQLRTGRIVASVRVPPGFISDLRGMVESPQLELETTRGGVSLRVTQQVQALVYSLNRQLQDSYIEANLEYVDLLRHGGTGTFLGQRFRVLGLDGMTQLLRGLPAENRKVAEIREFVRTARLALAQTDEALRATANPIELVETSDRGRTWVLSAQVQAYALALTITFLTLILAAATIAAERDENVLGRLARGLVSMGQLVAAKTAVAALVALGLGLAIALSFGVIIEVGNVEGGEPWERVPLLVVGIVLAGASVGALGVLVGAVAREARTASLAALLLVLPIVFLGLVPREVVPLAGWVSDAFPFVHAVRLFGSALYDPSPWGVLLREASWLAGLGLAFGGLARFGARRLFT